MAGAEPQRIENADPSLLDLSEPERLKVIESELVRANRALGHAKQLFGALQSRVQVLRANTK